VRRWQESARCKDEPLENFFEAYETDRSVAEDTDDMCLDCPVRNWCLKEGVETAGTGVFGGVYLSLGKFSKTRNSHKLPYVAEKLEEQVNDIRKNK
jgi:hypothetical protein